MKMTKVKIPNPETLKRRWLNAIVKEQTDRLIAYGEMEILRIGNDIESANTLNNLDRTGNLLDSLCWGLLYGGEMKKFGFYRSPQAYYDSHLHEYSNPMGESVNGRFMAQQFISSYSPTTTNGWEIFFAVLAPYWGYWEQGFTLKSTGTFYQWQVMTNHFDIVKEDLAPSKVTFNTYIP